MKSRLQWIVFGLVTATLFFCSYGNLFIYRVLDFRNWPLLLITFFAAVHIAAAINGIPILISAVARFVHAKVTKEDHDAGKTEFLDGLFWMVLACACQLLLGFAEAYFTQHP
jgi:hypothetical protein